MSFYVPPHALYTVHGNPDEPKRWRRFRVMFIDEDGDPWIVGSEPFTIDGEHHRGDKNLRSAKSYADFLGIVDQDDEESGLTIPATPGWEALFASACPGEDPDVDVYHKDIAAWSVDKAGHLYPITDVDDGIMAPSHDELYQSDGDDLIAILGPSQELPDVDEQRHLGRKSYKIRTYLERFGGAAASADGDKQ